MLNYILGILFIGLTAQ